MGRLTTGRWPVAFTRRRGTVMRCVGHAPPAAGPCVEIKTHHPATASVAFRCKDQEGHAGDFLGTKVGVHGMINLYFEAKNFAI